jgi:hypothetical protein
MCAPFWWNIKTDGDERARILNNGTICYVNTGTKGLGITAFHVLEKYLAHIEKHGAVAIECQFGSSTISPEKRVIAKTNVLDLATIDVPEVFVTAGNRSLKSQHHPLAWPPKRAQTGDVVLYGGHPGILREDNFRTAEFPFQWIVGTVNDVSNRTIVLEPAFDGLIWVNPEPGKSFNRDFGGMSGGPVFRIVDGVIVRLELVGIITDFAIDAEKPGADADAVLATHSEVVSHDGGITE